jgi:predicted transcriptional regulator
MNRVLTITLESDWKKNLRQSREKINQALDGGGYQGEFLNFESASVFFGKMTERRWDIIHELQSRKSTGIRELSRIIGRDVRRVHDDVSVLLELGLIEQTDEGKIVCPYTDIHVDMHLTAA